MPEVYVHIVAGRTADQKRGLVQDITAAVVRHLKSDPANVLVQIVETSPENKSKCGVLFSERG